MPFAKPTTHRTACPSAGLICDEPELYQKFQAQISRGRSGVESFAERSQQPSSIRRDRKFRATIALAVISPQIMQSISGSLESPHAQLPEKLPPGIVMSP